MFETVSGNMPPEKMSPQKFAPTKNCSPGKLPPGKLPHPAPSPEKMHSKKLFYYIFVVVNIILQFFYKLFIVSSFRGMSRSPVTFIIDALVTVINGIN